MKLVLAEPETRALREYLRRERPSLATSLLASIEVRRAVKVASPDHDLSEQADDVVHACELVEVDAGLVAAAERLASRELRTLDAAHLASALSIRADQMLVYDVRLATAAESAGLHIEQPK